MQHQSEGKTMQNYTKQEQHIKDLKRQRKMQYEVIWKIEFC